MYRYGIIAIGYNRVNSIKRLLNALKSAEYKGQSVTLIISIDHSEDGEVEAYANDFEWTYGNKIVKAYQKRLGLREHVLLCGTYLEEFDLDAVAVFEDDIYPSNAFFNYMCQVVPFYMDDPNIAGISLYTHLWNVNAAMPFQPAYNGFDNFFMYFAQSWGQVWTKNQWKDFMEWYKNNIDLSLVSNIPDYVKCWPESSWLKYHIAYCMSEKKCFVYPYHSLATCVAEAGEHTAYDTNIYEVPLEKNSEKIYTFQKWNSDAVQYDAFFERVGIGRKIGIDENELCVDLYGSKGNRENKRYWLTRNSVNYLVKQSYALKMRPHEENIIQRIQGLDIFLYDTSQEAERPQKKYHELSFYFRLECDEVRLINFLLKKKFTRVWKRVLERIRKV